MRLLLLMVFGLVAMCLATPAVAADRCGLCREELSGEYTRFTSEDGRKLEVCARCLATANRCAMCSIPTRNAPYDGLPALCSSCRPRAMRCDVCAQLLVGRYSEYRLPNGSVRRACETCERTKPACSSCGLPYRASDLTIVARNERWCASCLATATRCDLCRTPISGAMVTLAFRSGTWCEDCFKNAPHCSVCNAPMTEPARTLSDGRELCTACDASAVRDPQAMARIAREVAPSFAELLGSPLTMPPVRMVTRAQLDAALAADPRRAKGNWPPQPRAMLKELGAYHFDGTRGEVLILESLPEDLAWETIAHELAHAWQNAHFPGTDDPVLVEGFAQWVAETLCYRHGRRAGLEKLRARPDFYGQAYRVVNDIETRGGGVKAVLSALRNNALPPGSWGGT